MFSGCMLPAICLIATGYVSGDVSLAVFLVIAGIGFSGISYVVWCVNQLDLAPQYAGQNCCSSSYYLVNAEHKFRLLSEAHLRTCLSFY